MARGPRTPRSEIRWSLGLERRPPTWTRALHGQPPRIHYEGRGSPAAQKWPKQTYPCRDDRSQIPWSEIGSSGTFQNQRRCVSSRNQIRKTWCGAMGIMRFALAWHPMSHRACRTFAGLGGPMAFPTIYCRRHDTRNKLQLLFFLTSA